MRMLGAVLLVVAGCTQQPATRNDTTAAVKPEPAVTAGKATSSVAPAAASAEPTPVAMPTPQIPLPTPRLQLPRPLRGVWTADPTGDCVRGNPLRMVVASTGIDFHDRRAEMVSIDQVDPHSWHFAAQVTRAGATRLAQFNLGLNEDERGTLTRVERPLPDTTYIRCRDNR